MEQQKEKDIIADRVEKWQLALPPTSLPDDIGIAARLYLACSTLYRSILDKLATRADITKPMYRNIQRSFSRLVIWSHSQAVSDGTLDLVLHRSSDLRALTLSFLVNISQILTYRLIPAGGLLSDENVRNHSSSIQDLAQEGLRLVLDGKDASDDRQLLESSPGSIMDSLERIASNLHANVQCLVDLGPLVDDLALDHLAEMSASTSSHPQLETFQVSSHQALNYCRKIRDRFRELPRYLVERLGEANALRSAIIQKCRAKPQKEEVRITDFSESIFSCSLPKLTETTKSTLLSDSVFDTAPRKERREADSSFEGTAFSDTASRATFASFSTSFSTIDRGRPRIPPLPEGAEEGKAIDCLTCCSKVTGITNRIAWKDHVFGDLQPYVCTVENCDEGVVLFKSSYVWAMHERSHQSSNSNCPFCPKEMPQRNPDFFKHVSGHLREVALAVLPQTSVSDVESDSELNPFEDESRSNDWPTRSSKAANDTNVERASNLEAATQYTGTVMQEFIDNITQRFPNCDGEIASRLAKALWDSAQRLQALKEIKSRRDQNDEHLISPSYNSGTLLPADNHAAEIILMYRGHNGSPVSIPAGGSKRGGFQCPACGMAFRNLKKSEWRNHLFADLRPYVCCQRSCTHKHTAFANRSKWIEHLAKQHALSPPWKSVNCTLCHEMTGDGKEHVTNHLARHLEEIALDSLLAGRISGATTERARHRPSLGTRDNPVDLTSL